MKIERPRLIYSKLQMRNRVFPVLSDSNSFNPMDIVKKMRDMVPEYAPNNTVYSVLNEKS